MVTNSMFYMEQITRLRQSIEYYRAMVYSTACPAKRMYYQDVLLIEVDRLLALISQQSLMPPAPPTPFNRKGEAQQRQKVFTPEELAQFDGADGRPAYVAIAGVVYDVSREATWGGGTHFGLYAGQVLTAEFTGCHSGKEAILQQLPQVGILQT